MLLLDAYIVYISFYKSDESSQTVTRNLSAVDDGSGGVVDIDNCGEECRRYIDEKLAGELLPFSESPTPTEKVSTENGVSPATSQTKIKSVSYVPIPGDGSTLSTDWVSLPGTDFYLSKSDYPGLTGVYFEANMRLMNGNGAAFLRIYDATHGVGVSGSEVQTSNQGSSFVSGGPLSLWEGTNHYLVQARSLTADTTIFESGRLKIISEY